MQFNCLYKKAGVPLSVSFRGAAPDIRPQNSFCFVAFLYLI